MKKKMEVAYVAGPYRASSVRGIQQNIERASDVSYKYWKKGYAVISPHKNTAFFDGEALDDTSLWLEGDLEILRNCDVIIMMKNYKTSKGAVAELEFAKKLGIKVIYDK